ncbi:MAG: tetratricopeptide repeat protein [Bacteroidales bacterium]|nr:tetratricopeptide repeat protein [Bacteroidales bacterium]MDY0314763.1 tetratricopeptide repeat protein [Bacteroidales bacterium]
MTNKFKILCFLLSITLNYNFSLLAQTNLTSSNSINFDYYLNLSVQYQDSIGNKDLYYANQALKYAEKENNSAEIIKALVQLAEISRINGNWNISLENLNKALELSSEIDDPDLLHSIYLDLGVIYKYLNQLELALEYYHKALEQSEIQNNIKNQAMCLTNIANIYLAQEKFEKALNYYKKSFDYIKKSNAEINSIILILNNIAVTYMSMNDFKSAKQTLFEALEIMKDENPPIKLQVYTNLFTIELNLKNYTKAGEYAKVSESILKISENTKSRLNLYEKLFQLYSEQAIFDKAIDYQTKYIQLKDSIYTDELNQTLSEYKTKYELDKLEVENLLKKKELENKSKINKFLIIVILSISLLFILLINYFIKSKLLNKKLNSLNNLLEIKNQEIRENLKYSKQIQLSLVANKALSDNLLILDLPKDEVGGDFFITREYFDSEIYILGDCTGHGSSGALLSIFSINAIDQIINENLKINEILNRLNNRFLKQLSTSKHLKGESLSITILQKNNDKLFYSGSKQKIWHYNSCIKEILEYKTDNIIIGKEENKLFSLYELDCKENDIVFLSTDGYPDQFGDNKKGKLKYPKFRKILKTWAEENFTNTDISKNQFLEWKGNSEQTDDILIIGIKI